MTTTTFAVYIFMPTAIFLARPFPLIFISQRNKFILLHRRNPDTRYKSNFEKWTPPILPIGWVGKSSFLPSLSMCSPLPPRNFYKFEFAICPSLDQFSAGSRARYFALLCTAIFELSAKEVLQSDEFEFNSEWHWRDYLFLLVRSIYIKDNIFFNAGFSKQQLMLDESTEWLLSFLL